MLLTTLTAVAPHTSTVSDSKKTVASPEAAAAGAGATVLIISIVQIVFGFLFGVAAAKLSYDRFGSVFWAILAFFFSEFYVIYYSFFVSKPGVIAGRRR